MACDRSRGHLRCILLGVAVTIIDVAAAAGVSVRTVSRVVNHQPHTRPEVVERVRAAIDELGWVPHRNARALRTGRTGTIGIAVAELRRAHLAAVVEALVQEASRRGLSAIVEPTHQQESRVAAMLAAEGRLLDGTVVVGSHPLPEVATTMMRLPTVVSVQGAGDPSPYDSVQEDVVEAAALVARHVALMGRRRPVLLAAPPVFGTPSLTSRYLSLLENALAPTVQRTTVITLETSADRRAGFAAVDTVLDHHDDVDAIICADDEVALGVLSALDRRDTTVPGKVAVIGYGDLDEGRFSTPTLTSVDPGRAQLARSAVEMLTDRIARPGAASRTELVPVRLRRRESTMRYP